MKMKHTDTGEIGSKLREEIARLRRLSDRSQALQEWAKERNDFYRTQVEKFRDGTLNR